METSAIFHRPESEYAYLYKKDEMHIRIRTKRGDVSKVNIISGDPYLHGEKKWYMDNMPLELILSTDVHDYWFIKTGAEFRRLSYAFHVIGNDGTEVLYGDRGIFPFDETALSDANSFFRMPYFQEIDRFKAPDWVKKTIWYQIFPERFANGDTRNDPEGTLPWGSKKHPTRDDFYGGDLQGVIDNLDYLVDLGINGIYFCPIFKATSNHKYDTTDYYEIDVRDFKSERTAKILIHMHEVHLNGIGDYIINESNGSNAIDGLNQTYLHCRVFNESTNSYQYYRSYENSGTLKMTKDDFANRIISGTFNCKVKNSTDENDIIEIKDGRFDLNWQTLPNVSFP